MRGWRSAWERMRGKTHPWPGPAGLTVVGYTRFTPNAALRAIIEQHPMDSTSR
jgi:hypothetical protein